MYITCFITNIFRETNEIKKCEYKNTTSNKIRCYHTKEVGRRQNCKDTIDNSVKGSYKIAISLFLNVVRNISNRI